MKKAMLRSARLLPLLTLLGLLTFILSACDTGGGYGARRWDPDQRAPQTAVEAPKPLSEDGKAQEPEAPAPLENAPPQQTEALPTVKVALLLPLSGPHKALGDGMLKASQIALFDLGYTSFAITPQDTQGTADGGREAARKAINDGAQLILGPVFAEAVKGAKTITEPARVPMIAFSTDWTLAGNNTFIMGFLPFDQVARLTEFVAGKNIRRIGLIAPQTDYGRAVAKAYDGLAPRYGLQTTERLNLAAQTTTLSPQLRSFSRYDSRQASQNPDNIALPFDAVLMPVGGNQATTISTLLAEYGLPPTSIKRLGTGLLDDPALANDASLSGAWFAAPSPRLRAEFEKKYLATYGTPAPRLSTLAYDATALAAVLAQRGVKANGRPDFNRNAILNPNGFFGVDGIFRFRRDGTVERGLAILEINRGRINVLDDAPTTFQK